MPCYDHSKFGECGRFSKPPVPDNVTIHDLNARSAANYFVNVCFNRANVHNDNINSVFYYDGPQEMPLNNSWARFVPNSTYWFNEDLHVGHVHYDIVLMQILQSQKVDRLILQRSVCKDRLCQGIGVMEAFYKAYFAAIFEAAGQPSIPVYVRWTFHSKEVKPLVFSVHSPDNYNHTAINSLQPIRLEPLMCFDTVMRSGKRHQYGAIPSVSISAVQKFKAVAYRMINTSIMLSDRPPFRILFSHRGQKASRHIANLDQFNAMLAAAFPPPNYIIQTLNNSLDTLTWRDQMTAVATAHVVITDHGAFEGNMIYMKNSSLLVELFGTYGCNEVHTFQRLALSFGIFYSRTNSAGLTNHRAHSYNITRQETSKVLNIVKQYFETVPALLRRMHS